MITIQIRDNYRMHGYMLCPWWLGRFFFFFFKMLSPQHSRHCRGCPSQHCGCCREDLWERGTKSRLCVIVPLSLRLQQYGTATGFISTSYRSLHRLDICGSPRKSLGSIDLPWPCFTSRTNQPFWGTAEGRRAEVSCRFLAVIWRGGTRKSGWEIWPA